MVDEKAEKPLLKTEVPGPKSKELAELKERYISKSVGVAAPVYIQKAFGSILYDIDGNQFIDMACGIGVNNIGNCHKEIVDAIKDQAEKFLHLCFMVTPYELYVRLAEKMAKIMPKPNLTKSAFFNSGAEAVENTVKYARHYSKKAAVFSFEHSFHGRTSMTLALTAKESPYKAGFGTMPESFKLDFAYCYRCPLNLEYPSCGIACAEKVDEVLSQPKFEDDTALVVGEPIAGEGGFIVPPDEFYPKISKICKKHNVLFAADEIQTGAGRTGKMWCIEHWPEVEPDILISAKGMGGGMVISAVTGKAEIMDAPQIGGIGGTFGGHPTACAAALAQIKLIEENLSNVDKIRDYMTKRLNEMKDKFDLIGEVRGKGAMWAIELVKDRSSKEPAADEAKNIKNICLQKGMMILTCGTFGNVIRMHPSLIIPDETLAESMDILETSIAEAIKK